MQCPEQAFTSSTAVKVRRCSSNGFNAIISSICSNLLHGRYSPKHCSSCWAATRLWYGNSARSFNFFHIVCAHCGKKLSNRSFVWVLGYHQLVQLSVYSRKAIAALPVSIYVSFANIILMKSYVCCDEKARGNSTVSFDLLLRKHGETKSLMSIYFPLSQKMHTIQILIGQMNQTKGSQLLQIQQLIYDVYFNLIVRSFSTEHQALGFPDVLICPVGMTFFTKNIKCKYTNKFNGQTRFFSEISSRSNMCM
jgi:hypothetical protein